MSTTEETHQCEIELELSKHDFQEDVSQIGQKLHETRVSLSPTHVVGEEPLLISALGLLVGFVLGYWESPVRKDRQADSAHDADYGGKTSSSTRHREMKVVAVSGISTSGRSCLVACPTDF